ncbi:MAG: hypothetical protein KY476_10100, partial [Planctomycetes bacterium]|nr:hypothetical protein [Planctomycetota bacterium]
MAADASQPAAGDADWGIGSRKSRPESNTKFGVALIVLLVCTLGFVIYKKMDRRRADAGPAAETSAAPSPRPANRKPIRPGDPPVAPGGVADAATSPQQSQVTQVRRPNPFDRPAATEEREREKTAQGNPFADVAAAQSEPPIADDGAPPPLLQR